MVAVAPIDLEPRQVPFIVRSRRAEDDQLIYSAWSNNAWEAEPARWIPWSIWAPKQRDWIAQKLDRGTTLVMCHPADADELMGFVCYELQGPALIVHWLYVKSIVRRLGIARAVFETLPEHQRLVFTQPSQSIRWIRRLTGASYDPWA